MANSLWESMYWDELSEALGNEVYIEKEAEKKKPRDRSNVTYL